MLKDVYQHNLAGKGIASGQMQNLTSGQKAVLSMTRNREHFNKTPVVQGIAQGGPGLLTSSINADNFNAIGNGRSVVNPNNHKRSSSVDTGNGILGLN